MTDEQKRQLDAAQQEVLDAIDERDAIEKTLNRAKVEFRVASDKATKLFYAVGALKAEFEGTEQFEDDDG